HFVRDLACSTVERKCADVIEGPSSSVVRIYDPDLGSDPVQLDGVTKARGLAWTKSATGAALIVAEEDRVRASSPSGEMKPGALFPAASIAGGVSVYAHGTVAAAPLGNPLMLQVFDPSDVLDLSTGADCDPTVVGCSTLVESDFTSSLASIAKQAVIRQVIIYGLVAGGDVALYIRFDGDDRIALARMGSNWRLSDSLSGFIELEEPARYIASFRGGARLFLVTGTSPETIRAYWARLSTSIGAQQPPTPMTLPDGACPSALDSQWAESSLLIADDCAPALWEIPLDQDGVPMGEGFVKHELRDCVPFLLASVQRAGEEEAATFVGCKERNHILVLGRH